MNADFLIKQVLRIRRRILLFFISFLFAVGFSQNYIDVPCALGYPPEAIGFDDSVVVISDVDYMSFERVRPCDFGDLFTYVYTNYPATDSLSDSIKHKIQKLLYPYLGKWAYSRLEIQELRLYNEYPPDSATVAEYPYCKTLGFEFTCLLRFDNNQVFPFLLQLDKLGRIKNKKDIPHGLNQLEKLELISPCEIYNKAKVDPFFTNDLPWYAIELHYSNKVGILYYVVKCADFFSENYYDYDEGGKQSSSLRYIFYNAVTGNVVWKTNTIRTFEMGADFTNESIEFPDNPFQNYR